MDALESFAKIIGVSLAALSVIGALMRYLEDVKHTRQKDLPPRIKFGRVILLLLHTSVFFTFGLFLWLLDTGGELADNWLDMLLCVMGTLAVLYVILSIAKMKDEFETRSEDIGESLEALEIKQQSEEAIEGFLKRVGKSADQKELQKHIKKQERRMKGARNRLLHRLFRK